MHSADLSNQGKSTIASPTTNQPTLEYYHCGRRPLIRLLARPSVKSVWGAVLEVSVGGIRLIVDRHFEPGTLLAIQLQRKFVGMSGILTAKVLHATQGDKPAEKGRWLLDCSLSRSLTDD